MEGEGTAHKRAVVVIPTTDGPAIVLTLYEKRQGNSTVSIFPAKSPSSQITFDYQNFVGIDSGLILRAFGKPGNTAYRVEVSGALASGQSFELPIFLAHALRERDDRLVALTERSSQRPTPDELRAADLVWATGIVDAGTCTVLPVQHVRDKLHKSRPLFTEALAQGRRIHILVPTAGLDDIDAETAAWLGERGLAVEPISGLDRALQLLGLPLPAGLGMAPAGPAPDAGRFDTIIARFRERAGRIGVSEATLGGKLADFAAQGVGDEDLPTYLGGWLDQTQGQFRRRPYEDATFQAAVEEANRRLAAGRPDASSTLVAEFRREEREEAERQRARTEARLKLLAETIRIDELSLDTAAVVSTLWLMAEVEGIAMADRRRYLVGKADEYFVRGQRRGQNIALLVALEANQQLLAETARDSQPAEWAMAQKRIGNVLKALGERDSGTHRLEAAIRSYRQAQQVWMRGSAPLDWATLQSNIGAALVMLSERRRDRTRAEEAVATLELALEECKRELVPLDWAMTLSNLARAFERLGGADNLRRAIDLYRQALEERTREIDPVGWAATQDSLGNAHRRLADQGGGVADLKAGIAALQQALEVRTREVDPAGWAETQSNLGAALRALGNLADNRDWLEQSVAAYRSALLEIRRETAPVQWAGAQFRLGNALRSLAAHETGTRRLDAAVDAYRLALQQLGSDSEPDLWTTAQIGLALALSLLGERTGDGEYFDGAAEAYRAAMLVRSQKAAPVEWARLQQDLGEVLLKRAEVESGTASLRGAIKALEAAQKITPNPEGAALRARAAELLASRGGRKRRAAE